MRHVAFDPRAGSLRRGGSRLAPAPGDALAGHLAACARHLPRVVQSAFGRMRAAPSPSVHDNMAEFRLILSGAGRMRIGRDELAFHAGDLLVMLPGDVHQTLEAGSGRHLSLHVWLPGLPARRAPRESGGTGDALLEFVARRLPTLRRVELGEAHPAAQALLSAHAAAVAGGIAGDALAGARVVEALAHLARHAAAAPVSEGARERRDRLLVAAIEEQLRRRYPQRLALDALLSGYGLHPNVVRGIFRRRTGRTVREAWLRARVAAAKQLLDAGESTAAVAAAVGFSDGRAFRRRFAALAGCAPSAWRERARGGNA